MKNVLLWGMGNEYEKLLNQIHYEIEKENINVVGIICRQEDKYCKKRDGFPVLSKKEVDGIEFDHVIVTTGQYFDAIRNEALELGIRESQIINGAVFHLPLFDFGKYISLIEDPVTILCDDCWGGYVYNRLSLPFSSPLINISWEKAEFANFLTDPEYYLSQELKMVSDGDIRKGLTPVASLGEGEKRVTLRLIHNATFDEGKAQWERRCRRINHDNFFVKFGLESNADQELKNKCREVFSRCPYKKILTYYGEDIEEAFMSERFPWKELNRGYVEEAHYSDFFRKDYYLEINILDLLLYGKNYSREN